MHQINKAIAAPELGQSGPASWVIVRSASGENLYHLVALVLTDDGISHEVYNAAPVSFDEIVRMRVTCVRCGS